MSDRILVTLPSGEDVRLEQDGNLVTVWRWAETILGAEHASWVVAGDFSVGVMEDER